MATYKIMKSVANGKAEATGFESTRKREIEAMFNRFIKICRKNKDCMVKDIRIGYSIVTFYGFYGSVDTEYWITKFNK